MPKYMLTLSACPRIGWASLSLWLALHAHATMPTKAQEWNMLNEFRDKDLLRDVFVAIASLRQTWNLVSQYLSQWICLRMEWGAPLDIDECEELFALWTALGVDSECAELMAYTLHLRFVDGTLRVSSGCAGIPDLVETVKHALLGCWKLKKFTGSRWHTVGTSCRGAVVGLLTGLPGLVNYIMEVATSGKTFLGGWYRLHGGSNQLLCHLFIGFQVERFCSCGPDGRW